MKTNLILFIGVFLILSCSSDNNLKENDTSSKNGKIFESLNQAGNYENESMSSPIDANAFLNERYNGFYEIIDTYTLNAEGEGMQKLFKISIEGDYMKDVYLSANPESLEMLYFAEFDWEAGTLESKNFEYGETETLTVIPEENPLYIQRDMPLLEIISDVPPEVKSNGRFWGWECGKIHDFPGNDPPFRLCCYYVIWKNTGCERASPDDLPGRNPKIVEE